MKPRLVMAGLLLGALPALPAFAPAAWLADGLTRASGGKLMLAEASGTVWNGSAVLALTSGNDARSAIALPGRLSWRLGLHGGLPAARVQQACCINGQWVLRWRPGLQQQRILVNHEPASDAPAVAVTAANPAATPSPPPAAESAGTAVPSTWGHWPLSLLSGLGTPWNTMRLNGSMQLAAPPFELLLENGRLALQGQLVLNMHNVASRLSPLDTLGSYSLSFAAEPGASDVQLQLQTLSGALQLQGSGQWAPTGLRFQAQATAAPGSEESLNNLLNIIGVRQGAQSVLSIG